MILQTQFLLEKQNGPNNIRTVDLKNRKNEIKTLAPNQYARFLKAQVILMGKDCLKRIS